MRPPTPPQVLLATTLQPLVVQLAGSVARGATWLEQCLPHAPTPQQRATLAQELSALLREVGRRLVAWVLQHVEPDGPDETPSRLWWQGPASRRRRTPRTPLATLGGPVVVWRRLSEALPPRRRSLPPWELPWGVEAGVATPAWAARVGRWAAEQTPRPGVERRPRDQEGPGACATRRKLLGSRRAGMAPQRQAAQSAQVVRWLHPARAATGRLPPIRAGGRAGVTVPLRPRKWTAGATATGAVWERRGKRGGPVALGQRPEAGQTPRTAPWSALLKTLWSPVASQGLRFVSGSAEGSPPRASSQRVVKKRPAPTRPWGQRTWRRLVDSSHAGLYSQPRAAALFGSTPQGRAWAKALRTPLQTTSEGSTRVFPSASTGRPQHGLWGTPKDSEPASASLQKRTHGRRSRPYGRQRLPMGAGLTEAACTTVCTQRRQRSGLSWTVSGGQVILKGCTKMALTPL
jgi:hypothetical protein